MGKKVQDDSADIRILLDAVSTAVLISDMEGLIRSANAAAVQQYGYSLEALQQMHIADLSAPHLKNEISLQLSRSLKSSAPLECKQQHKNGSELQVEIFSCPVHYRDTPAVLSCAHDIKSQKNAQSALQKQEHLLKQLLDIEPGTVYIFDLKKQQSTYINQQWIANFGYAPDEVGWVEVSQIIHPDDLANFMSSRVAWQHGTDGEIRSIEYRIRDKKGDWHAIISRETSFSRNHAGQVSEVLGIARDVTKRRQAEALLIGQERVMEMVAAGTPLPETLTALIRIIEAQSPGMLGSILLLDKDGIHVRHGAAPSLPAEFVAAVDDQPIGPCAGSCGTAAYRKEAVFVEDIATDPLWADYKTIALPHGLHASWSTPIFSAQQCVLGTFAMYYRQPGLPQSEHLKLIDAATHIAAIAISRQRNEEVLRESEARYRLLFEYAPDGIVIADPQSYYLDANASICQMLGYSRGEFIGLRASDIVVQTEIQHIQPALQAIKTNHDYQREWQFRRKDGSIFTADVMATTMPDGNLLGLIRDVTERKINEARIQRLTNLYAALSQCNQAIVRCTSEAELFPQICRDAVNFGGMKMAWIGMLDATTKQVKPVASFGAGLEYLDEHKISIDQNDPTGRGPLGSAIRNNQISWHQDFQGDPTAIWHQRAIKFGWASVASLPLHRKGVVIGAFTLYAGEKNAFDEMAQKLLIEMAMDIDFALDNFRKEDERKRAEEELRISEQQLRTIIETEPECVKIVGKTGKLLEMNPAGLAMLEVDSIEQARQHSLLDFILPEHHDSFIGLHKQVMNGKDAILEFEIIGSQGTRRWLETHAAPLRDAKGEIVSLLGVTRDITERKRAKDRIQYLANFDALTGLPNRTQLDDRLKYALGLAKRSGGHLAIMFVDIDRFKDINDTLGHSIGDAFLVEVAKRLQSVLREEDTVSRLGGDEFILMLPGNDAKGAAQVAQKLLEVIAEPCQIAQYDLTVTASIGIALYPDDGVDLETLSKNADTAMYRAKQEGRADYRFFTAEMQARAARNLQLINALRHALARDQFQLHYQPQVSMRDGRIIGAEALLRWQHPELGDVSPAEFIPVAEDSGLILSIGEWVLRTAVKQLKHWIDSGLLPMVIAVNLSAVQFRHPSLLDLVSHIFIEAQLLPEYLELELTEGVAMHDPQGAIAVMNKLHERGIRMSIDDFGTGYSSLNYLKKFKVYKLKIDQSFVRDINSDQEDRAIVSAIISMAKSLGLQTIAEGVETAEQLAFLREQGCDEAQGYYYSKPLSAPQFEAFVMNANQKLNKL